MDQVQMTPEVNPESPEYIEQMAAKGEAAVNNGNTHKSEAPTIPPKPAFVPDKFYNAETGEVNYEALAKSYTELEKQRSKQQPQETPKETQKVEQQEPENSQDEQAAAEKAVEQAGLDFDKLNQEYAENGGLTDETYEALEKSGIPRQMVDGYIEGQKALAEAAKAQAFSLTGGAEGYQAMVSWARAELSEAEIAAFNRSVNTMDAGVRDIAIRGLWARYTAESGNAGNLVQGKTSKVDQGQGFKSRQQMVDAMNDSRYKTDPAYREEVAKKIAASSIF